ncbi:NADAR family protein [[Clostridium] innocuum]|uniref:NADAR family protein n=1 Tax=Clostridium innocuum TaxID=1522 RepID=UPI000D6CB37F|nr:NADAR family protein [[Clostridium] innocuum]MCR0317471.1 NADAR family protein [[Clostridium] innocuum]MCR0371911.1 NADAR family protein [[Clostridium] innocuum]MCR0561272.1 NADAR family protein [[Clostridium] innocuum]MCR0604578.1 NADAR family protein [[Clostridium] innocuum]PWJ10154.1 hypothetical protein ATF84_12316 [[Clostridium] innocuum]
MNITISTSDSKNSWLNNDYPCLVIYEGISYKSAAAAYEASKIDCSIEECKSLYNLESISYITDELLLKLKECMTSMKRLPLANLSAAGAREYTRKIVPGDEWFEKNDKILTDIIRAKFSIHNNPSMYKQLLNTKNMDIIDGTNDNHMGRILMKVRDEIYEDEFMKDIY